MVLCEIAEEYSLFAAWAVLTFLAGFFITVLSGAVFVHSYVNPTFEQWQYKSNPKFPTPEMVRDEIIQMFKGVFASTICPALSIWMASQGKSQAYCGLPPDEVGGNGHLIVELAVIWIGSDFFEFFYHWCGHRFSALWTVHKHHHVFYNPSPFAVIADEYIDQFVRATPLVLLPLALPINIDLMMLVYAVFFYGYGVYLHWGFELESLPADHWLINTSFQHYLHHAISIKNKPYHTGFFFKIWDRMFGSLYHGDKVISAMEARKRGLRTREAWEAIDKPDYSPLIQLNFWKDALFKRHDLKVA